jgi:hypothetical protein
MMDFLPRLIPGTLLSRINATLAAVQSKSNNGNDYLWRVLELTVPGFDPVVPIQTPLWTNYEDIFHFSQAHLLYFQLQTKMHYHFMDRTRSGIFLRAIQHSDYADTVTTLQSHVNSYKEDYDMGFLPPHRRLHGLAESIHQNAQARLWDVISPHVQQLDMGPSLIQGLPPLALHSPFVYQLGRPNHTGNGYHDRDRDGGGSFTRGDCDCP